MSVASIPPRRLSLAVVNVAAPCPALWEEMLGDDRVRLCQQCQLHVYNLSEMTRDEAETFMGERTGRTCIRYFRRTDGTILTQDCPVGLRAVRRSLARLVACVAAVIGFLTLASWLRQAPAAEDEIASEGPISKFTSWIDPPGRWFGGVF